VCVGICRSYVEVPWSCNCLKIVEFVCGKSTLSFVDGNEIKKKPVRTMNFRHFLYLGICSCECLAVQFTL
jgi:hypothetical protein